MTTNEARVSDSVSLMLDRLEQFNAKERYWLLMNVLGCAGDPGTAALPVSRDVVRRWAARVDLIGPADGTRVVAALDYHLSWLHGALSGVALSGPRGWNAATYGQADDRPSDGTATNYAERLRYAVERNQEDVDFLLAWEAPGTDVPTLCLLMVEAKGVTSFHDRQTRSKVERLKVIRQQATEACSEQGIQLCPALLLVSPEANATDDELKEWERTGIRVGREALVMRNDLWRIRTRGGSGNDANAWRITPWSRHSAAAADDD